MNISRITALPTPYPLPRGDFLSSKRRLQKATKICNFSLSRKKLSIPENAAIIVTRFEMQHQCKGILKNHLAGAVSRRRLTVYNRAQSPVRQQELAPTKKHFAGSSLQLEPGGLCISGRCDCSTGYCLLKLQGSGCKPKPARRTFKCSPE